MKLEDQILGVQNAIIEGVYVYKSSFVKIIHTLILKEVNCFCVNDVHTRKCQFNFLENICVYWYSLLRIILEFDKFMEGHKVELLTKIVHEGMSSEAFDDQVFEIDQADQEVNIWNKLLQ